MTTCDPPHQQKRRDRRNIPIRCVEAYLTTARANARRWSAGPDVDVVSEEVLGIVFSFDRSQTRQVRSVRDRGGLIGVILKVIDVTRWSEIRRQRCKRVARPFDAPLS